MLDGKKSDEFLNELAIRLATSVHQLSEAARRLQLAELTYREYLVRLRRLDEHLCTLIDLLQGPPKGQEPPVSETNPEFCDPPPPPPPPRPKKLRYADYIEFSSFSELKKFEKMGEITEDDAKNFNGDDVMKRLLDGEPPEQKKKE